MALAKVDRLSRRARRVAKSVYHQLLVRHSGHKPVLFIVGCQRSGTTLLSRILDRDRRTSVYKEQSALSSRDGSRRLRLNPWPEVASLIQRDPAPLILIKPLVESQNVVELLDHFEGSKAVWLYRDYRAVASSYVRRWGGRSIGDLKFIVERVEGDWRYEKVSPETREVVVRHWDEDMDPHDASALFWYVRNRFVPELELENEARILLSSYADLVRDPDSEIRKVYRHLGVDLPPNRLTGEVHGQSLRRGRQIQLTPGVEEECSRLLGTLDQLTASRQD